MDAKYSQLDERENLQHVVRASSMVLDVHARAAAAPGITAAQHKAAPSDSEVT